MDVGAKLSKGRPKYRCVKTVDFGDFGVNAGLCVGRVFITKRIMLMVLNLAENCCILSATLSTFRDEGSKLKKSDVNAAASGGKSRFNKFST